MVKKQKFTLIHNDNIRSESFCLVFSIDYAFKMSLTTNGLFRKQYFVIGTLASTH